MTRLCCPVTDDSDDGVNDTVYRMGLEAQLLNFADNMLDYVGFGAGFHYGDHSNSPQLPPD